MLSNIIVTTNTATEAWDQWWQAMNFQARMGVRMPSRVGDVVGEVLNAITVILKPREGFVDSDKRKLSAKYAVGELLWYLSGSNRLSDIKPYSKFWENISDDGCTLNSAYGYRIFKQFGFDQWEHVKNLLINDGFSRQAVIHIKDASNAVTKDTPCTVALQYQLRENKLFATTFMRSNDIWLGFPYDVFSFTSLQVLMAMELGVDVGAYTHISGSLHLYERDVKNATESSPEAIGQAQPV